MDDFPGNSHRQREESTKKPKKEKDKEEKKLEKVVTGEVIERKKSFGTKIKETFVGGDAKAAGMYIVAEVLLPALRNMVVDATTKGIERVVYGDNAPRRSSGGGGRPRISYNTPVDRYFSQQRAYLPDQTPRHIQRQHNVNDIILVSREEAEVVVERLGDIIDQFRAASVADLKELVGLPSTYTDNGWGWTSISYVDIRQIREGYLISLPNVEPI